MVNDKSLAKFEENIRRMPFDPAAAVSGMQASCLGLQASCLKIPYRQAAQAYREAASLQRHAGKLPEKSHAGKLPSLIERIIRKIFFS